MAINVIDKNQFEEKGFLIIPRFIDLSFCNRMITISQKHLSQAKQPYELETNVGYPGAPQDIESKGGATIRRLLNAYDRHDIFSEWVKFDKMKIVMMELLSSKILMLSRVHHNCIMTKQPMFSSLTGWHQDIRYWSYDRPELISAWLALGFENNLNGGLHLIPGSHRMHFKRNDFDELGFFKTDSKHNQKLIDTKISVALNPGDLLIFHCKTLHSAGWNRSSATKYSVVFTFHHSDNKPKVGSRSAFLESIRIE